MVNKRGDNFRKLNARRAITPHTNRKSDKSVTDGERLKREMEAKNAAMLWSKGYENEPRK